MDTHEGWDAPGSCVVWERAPPSPLWASTVRHACGARRRLGAAPRRSCGARPKTAWRCLADPVTASTCDALHSPPAHGKRKLTGATPRGHTAARDSLVEARAQAAPAWHHVAHPAFFFSQSHSTWSGPICWYTCAWHASWSCACCARRAENLSGLSFGRRCFPCAIGVGCTPYVLAHAWTVLRPLSASSATRAFNSALYCFRCVDISPLLLSISS